MTSTPPSVTRRPVQVPLDDHALAGELSIPVASKAVVLFAHGSGSSRHSPRNQFVARTLESHGLATLLIDLLTPAEEAIDRRTAHLRFDIGLLAGRLVTVIDWLEIQKETAWLNVGLFGASTGGGAAIAAAALRPYRVASVVSRGGRPDLAGAALARLKSPTLLIVGGHDIEVINLNQDAMARMRGNAVLEIVPGATHLFEEPGALERVAELAADFFCHHLSASRLPAGVNQRG